MAHWLGSWYSVQLVVHVHYTWTIVFARETSALRGSERKRERTSFYWTVVLIQLCRILAAVLHGTPSLLQCLGGAKAKINLRHLKSHLCDGKFEAQMYTDHTLTSELVIAKPKFSQLGAIPK